MSEKNITTTTHVVTATINPQASITPLISSNAYSIHHSDSPSTVLVTPLLTGDNYGPWCRAITMALRAKSKYCFVDGSLSKPTSAADLANWERCNDLVSSWILNSVAHEIRPSILYADAASQIWTDLQERFSQSNMPKIYQLKQSISALKQEGMTVSSYFTQLKSLWDELNNILSPASCICGNAKIIMEQQNQDRAMEFLQGLHDSFSAVRSQILLMEPFPSIQRIYNLVRQEVKQQEINIRSVPTIESATLQVSKQHRPSGKRQRPFCDHCNRHGHTRATCYQIHGFPNNQGKSSSASLHTTVAPAPTLYSHVAPVPSSAGPQITHEQYNKLLALLTKEESVASAALLTGTILSCMTSRWIIDSGASNHICSSLSFFSSYTLLKKNVLVELPDSSHASVTHIDIV